MALESGHVRTDFYVKPENSPATVSLEAQRQTKGPETIFY